METAILVTVLIALIVFGIRSYMKKLSSGCCGTSVEKEKRLPVKDADKKHYPYAYPIAVEGMHCANCAARLENAFNGQEGMWAQADAAHGHVLLRAKDPLAEGRIRQIVALAGYRVVRIEEKKSCGEGKKVIDKISKMN